MLRLRIAVLVLLAVWSAAFPLLAQEALYREEEVTFESDEATLAGTLTLPFGEGPFPAVILLSGSGASDRDESLAGITTLRPFFEIADYLTREGIAVLRYDDRGVGESTGDFATATSADLAVDARAAVDYLKTRADIDPEQIGLLGHSEGGILAAMAAADNPDIAFVVSLAGPAVQGRELLERQSEIIARASGATEAQIEAILAQARESLAMITNEDWEALEALMREQLEAQMSVMSEDQVAELGDPEELIAASLKEVQNWLRFFILYNPAEDWQRVSAPILAIYGDLDLQVEADQNAPVLEALLEEVDHPDYTIIRLPTANHLFQEATTGTPTEYGTLEPKFVPELLPTIAEWIQERVAT